MTGLTVWVELAFGQVPKLETCHWNFEGPKVGIVHDADISLSARLNELR